MMEQNYNSYFRSPFTYVEKTKKIYLPAKKYPAQLRRRDPQVGCDVVLF